jgi:hypothetical protein
VKEKVDSIDRWHGEVARRMVHAAATCCEYMRTAAAYQGGRHLVSGAGNTVQVTM